MSKSIAEQLESVQGTDASLNPSLETVAAFNLLSAFTHDEVEALSNLTSVRMKPIEVEGLERIYPQGTLAELFIIWKMRELARNEIVASEWRKFGGEWKNQATSYARQLGSSEDVIRKYAIHQIVELKDKIPSEYHEATIKHVIVKLDKGSEDSRVVEMTKYFKS
jgi:hypothetical protein